MHRVLITGRGRGHRPVVARDIARRLSGLATLGPGAARAGARRGGGRHTEISDMAAVERMVAGVDGIIHLGGISGENEWEKILEGNIVGLYNMFEAARRAGVKRIVVATSNHAVGFYPRDQTIDHRVVPRPDSRYGVSKAFAEALASLYADKHGIGFLCTRIGNFGDEADRQAPAVDLDQPARLHPARAHRARASRYPLRDRLRRLEQPALLVRQFQRRAARLPAAGRFRALCRGGARRRSRPAADPIAEHYQGGTFCAAEYTAQPPAREAATAPRAPLPAGGRAQPWARDDDRPLDDDRVLDHRLDQLIFRQL